MGKTQSGWKCWRNTTWKAPFATPPWHTAATGLTGESQTQAFEWKEDEG